MSSPYSMAGQENAYQQNAYLPAVFLFIDKVGQLFAGNLKVEMAYGSQETLVFSLAPDGEQQVVEAVAAGDFDLAWAGTRVFDTSGLTRFAALHAPLLVGSYPPQAAIIDSDVDEQMLDELEEIDLTGLALLAGGLRKPLACRSRTTPTTWS